MKEISELNFPEDIRYSKDHEWARVDGDKVKIGITDYAQDQLGDVVFVDLPEVEAAFGKGDEFGTVESVKAVSEIYMPIGGEILAVNTRLEDSSELVNNNPYNEGWMIAIKPADLSELDELMNKDTYLEMLRKAQS